MWNTRQIIGNRSNITHKKGASKSVYNMYITWFELLSSLINIDIYMVGLTI